MLFNIGHPVVYDNRYLGVIIARYTTGFSNHYLVRWCDDSQCTYTESDVEYMIRKEKFVC